jgi:hypothetical protein
MDKTHMKRPSKKIGISTALLIITLFTQLTAHAQIGPEPKSHAGDNDYQMSMKMFRFDADGNYIGWMVLTNEISINEAADEYAGSGIAEVFNADGVLVAQICPTFVGSRFTGGLKYQGAFATIV